MTSILTDRARTAAANDLLDACANDDFAHISPSVYETARVVADAPWLDGHLRRMAFLRAQQHTDGGWGQPGYDGTGAEGYRLVPTLSAVEALLTVLAGTVPLPERDAVAQAARSGIRILRNWLAAGAGHEQSRPDTVAIELIVPGLIERINDRLTAGVGLGDGPAADREFLPQPNPGDLVLLTRLRAAARAGAAVPDKLWHTWEMLHPGVPRVSPVYPVAGAVSCSPAATTSWLGTTPDPDEPAGRYLAELLRREGGPVPVATPMPYFERSWILNVFATHGVAYTMRDDLLTGLDAALGEHGAPAGPGLPADGDDTACVLYALDLHGAGRRPDSMMQYFAGDHFRCYPEERTPSSTVNAHAVEALGHWIRRHPRDTHRYEPALRAAVDWLLAAQRTDGRWDDKWHASPYYATAVCAQALTEYGGSAARHAIGRAVRWGVESRHDGGGWGIGPHGTAEETTYAAWLLTLADGPGADRALATAWTILADATTDIQSPTLWIGKDIYAPERIIEATRLAVVHKLSGRRLR